MPPTISIMSQIKISSFEKINILFIYIISYDKLIGIVNRIFMIFFHIINKNKPKGLASLHLRNKRRSFTLVLINLNIAGLFSIT